MSEGAPTLTTTAPEIQAANAASLGAEAHPVAPARTAGVLGRLKGLFVKDERPAHDDLRRAAEAAHPDPNALKTTSAAESPAHDGYSLGAQQTRRDSPKGPDQPYFFANDPRSAPKLAETTPVFSSKHNTPIADDDARITDMRERAILAEAEQVVDDAAVSIATEEPELINNARPVGLGAGRPAMAGLALATTLISAGTGFVGAAEVPQAAQQPDSATTLTVDATPSTLPTNPENTVITVGAAGNVSIGEKPSEPPTSAEAGPEGKEFRYATPGMPELKIDVVETSGQSVRTLTVTMPDGRVGIMNPTTYEVRLADGTVVDDLPEGMRDIYKQYGHADPETRKAFSEGAKKIAMVGGQQFVVDAQGNGPDGNPVSRDPKTMDAIRAGFGATGGLVINYESKTQGTSRETLAQGQEFDVMALMGTPEGRKQIDQMFADSAPDVDGRLKPTPGVDGTIKIGPSGARGEHAKWSVVQDPDGGTYKSLFVEGARVVTNPDGSQSVVGGTYVILRTNAQGALAEGAVMRLNNGKLVVGAEGPFTDMMDVADEGNLDQTQVAKGVRIEGEDGTVYLVFDVGSNLAPEPDEEGVNDEICQADGGVENFVIAGKQSKTKRAFNWLNAKVAAIGQCVGFRKKLDVGTERQTEGGSITVFEVSLPDTPPPDVPPELPATGGETAPLTGLGTGLVTAGAGAVLESIRRQRTKHLERKASRAETKAQKRLDRARSYEKIGLASDVLFRTAESLRDSADELMKKAQELRAQLDSLKADLASEDAADTEEQAVNSQAWGGETIGDGV